MGLLDQLLGAATSSMGNTTPNHQGGLQGVTDLLHSPGVGGIGGLAQMFQSKGLGHLMSGWVGTGPNPGVSPSQLTQVLGQDRINQFATQAGVPHEQAGGYLAQLLPHVIDHLTPDGQMPQGQSTASGAFDMLKSKLLGG